MPCAFYSHCLRAQIFPSVFVFHFILASATHRHDTYNERKSMLPNGLYIQVCRQEFADVLFVSCLIFCLLFVFFFAPRFFFCLFVSFCPSYSEHREEFSFIWNNTLWNGNYLNFSYLLSKWKERRARWHENVKKISHNTNEKSNSKRTEILRKLMCQLTVKMREFFTWKRNCSECRCSHLTQ